jgi:hypothetical protein
LIPSPIATADSTIKAIVVEPKPLDSSGSESALEIPSYDSQRTTACSGRLGFPSREVP